MAGPDAAADLYYPGVTDVHPSLKVRANQPLRMPGASPTQAVAGTAMRLAAQGGAAGALLGLGAVAAVAAVEWMGAERRRTESLAFIDRLVSEPPRTGPELRTTLQELDAKWRPSPAGESVADEPDEAQGTFGL